MKTRTKLAVFLTSVCLTAASAAMVAGCGDVVSSLTVGDPTNICYDGSKITWDAADNAAKYSVSINGGAATSTGSSTFITYTTTDSFTVTVTASNDLDSGETTQSFVPAQSVTDLAVDETCTITWTGVSLVSSYNVTLNDTTVGVNDTKYQVTDAGKYTVSVSCNMGETDANGAKYYSVKGETITFTKLGTVDTSTISYDADEKKLTFGSVANAVSYDVYVNNEKVADDTTSRTIDYDAGGSDFSVKIIANGSADRSVYGGDESEEKSYYFLDLVTGVKLDEGVLVWNEVENADSYIVKIGSKEYTVTTNKYDGAGLVAGKNLEISIKAVGDGDKDSTGTYFSTYTTPMQVQILSAPAPRWNSSLGLDGGQNNYEWDLIDGATGYQIKITLPDGTTETHDFGSTTQNYGYDFPSAGTYTLQLRTLAPEAQDNVCSSAWSSAITVERPAKPEKVDANFITSNATNLKNGFEVTAKATTGYTYLLWCDGKQIDEKSTPQFTVKDIVDEDVLTEQNFTYSISVQGSISTKKIILNSLENDYLEFDIKVLGMPKNVRMEGYTLSYDEVTGATNGYAITGVTGATYVTEYDTSRDLDSDLSSGSTYYLQVCAEGNGSDVLPSNYSDQLVVQRLAIPYNLKIDTADSSGGKLSYEIEDYATGVELYLNNVVVEDSSYTIENMNEQITTQGTAVALKAVGNYTSTDGIYYMTSQISTSKTFFKLATPSNLTVSNTALSWDLSGINSEKLGKVTFRVYTNNEVQFNPEGSARSVYFEDKLEGGKTYDLKVRAIGDGEEFINSEYSEVVSIYRLETPDVTKIVETGLYSWTEVADAVSYTVTVDGSTAQTTYQQGGGATVKFDPVTYLTQIKTYTITVTAVGNGGTGTQKTISSIPCTITQQVKQLDRCEIKLAYDKEAYATDGNIVVQVSKETANAKGYTYYANGITASQVVGEEYTGGTYDANSVKVYKYNPSAAGTYTVYAAAVGGTFTSDGTYYTIDSQNSASASITILGTPNQSDIELTSDGMIRFTAISGASTYSLTVTVTMLDGTTATGTVTLSTANYSLTNSTNLKNLFGSDTTIKYADMKNITVTLQAVGNTTLNSTTGYYEYTAGTPKVSGNTVTRTWENVHTS